MSDRLHDQKFLAGNKARYSPERAEGAYLLNDPLPGVRAVCFLSRQDKIRMQSHLLDQALTILPNEGCLVNVISRRVRQLTNGHRPMILNEPGMGLADIALTELIEGKLRYERTEKFVPEPIISRRGGEHQTDGARGSSSTRQDALRS